MAARRVPSLTRDPPLARTHEFLVAMVVAGAHAALAATGQLRPYHLLIMLLTLGGMAFFARKLRAIPQGAWNAGLVLVLILSILMAALPPRDFESFYHSIAVLVLYVVAQRYFTRSRPAHDLHLIMLALLEVCMASIATISLSFLASLAVFSVCVLASMMIESIRREVARIGEHDRAVLHRQREALGESEGGDETAPDRAAALRLDRRFFLVPLATTAVVLVLGFMFFFLIPRVGRSLFSYRTGLGDRVSGFSESVEMGSVGAIKTSNRLVMRVSLEHGAPLPASLYFRGNALNHYDGRRWEDTLGVPRGGYYYYRSDSVVTIEDFSLPDSIKQEIILEPTNSTVLFGLPDIKSMAPPPRYRAVVKTDNEYVRLPLPFPIYDRVEYTVWSVPPPTGWDECEDAWQRSPSVSSYIGIRYLQMPADMDYIRDLSMEIVGGEQSPCRRARMVRDYLLNEYKYSLDSPSNYEADSLRHFLLESKEGHCEYYATALALMLRSLGIPSRVAAGYLDGDRNPIEDYYRVREKHAHTWVEMYVPGEDWMTLDATPADAEASRRSPLFGWLGDIYDALKFRWDRYVVDLNLRQQYQMASSIRNRGVLAARNIERAPANIRAMISSALRNPFIYIAVPLAAAVYFILFRSGKTLEHKRSEKQAARLALEYRKLLAQLGKRNIERAASETPLELCARVKNAGLPFAPVFEKATNLYNRARYKDAGETEAALAAIREARNAAGKR